MLWSGNLRVLLGDTLGGDLLLLAVEPFEKLFQGSNPSVELLYVRHESGQVWVTHGSRDAKAPEIMAEHRAIAAMAGYCGDGCGKGDEPQLAGLWMAKFTV
jgi:hypothetical protein